MGEKPTLRSADSSLDVPEATLTATVVFIGVGQVVVQSLRAGFLEAAVAAIEDVVDVEHWEIVSSAQDVANRTIGLTLQRTANAQSSIRDRLANLFSF